jgi:TolB-like protein
VLRSGDRLRMTAQLIRAATDEHLWAETCDRDVLNVLALQDGFVCKEGSCLQVFAES